MYEERNDMRFKEFLEAFETTADFLLNKDYSDKTFSDLLHDFEKSGGKMIGGGKYGQVFTHPNWNYVLKTFVDDNCYLKFCRFAFDNPHPAFPKFFGKPKRIVPQFLRINPTLYYVRVERLFPIADKNFLKDVVNFLQYGGSKIVNYTPDYIAKQKQLQQQFTQEEEIVRNLRSRGDREGYKNFKRTVDSRSIDPWVTDRIQFVEKHPEITKLSEGYNILEKHNFQCAWDIHSENIMQRASGELVLIDPLWYGSNPYMDAMLARRMETDDWGEPDELSLIRGGELPKRKKPEKVKVNQPQRVIDDAPF